MGIKHRRKIIILNGPPFSGKDEATKIIRSEYPEIIWCRFKDVLYRETARDLDIDLQEWITLCNDVELKDKPYRYYKGSEHKLTPRQILIHKSEKQLKVQYGDAGVAKITAVNIMADYPESDKNLFVFSDGGFNVEVDTLKKELNLDDNDLFVITLKRQGCDFSNDSREWYENPDVVIFNDYDIETLRTNVLESINNFINKGKEKP